MRPLKQEIRILGIDDGPFPKNKKVCSVLVVGTLYRGGNFMDGLLSTKIQKDGDDSTKKLIQLINNSKFKPQIQCIMIDGIALGGFNVIDINKLFQKTNLPVLCVIRKMPHLDEIEKAISYVKNHKSKWDLIKSAPPIIKIENVYCQWLGMDQEKVIQIIKISTTCGQLPEPLRIAHIIASGIVFGESKGGA